MTKRLQYNYDKRHNRLDQAKLQSRLFAKSQESNGVRLLDEAPRTVQTIRSYRLSPYFRHNVTLAAQIFVAERHKIIYYESLVTVANSEKVYIVTLAVEKQQRYPRVSSVDRYYE